MPSDIHKRDNQLYNLQDLSDWHPPRVQHIISQGVLNVGNKMMIFGDEGSWKSMLTIHTAMCLANGSPWLGFYTNKCNVLKLQSELPLYSDRDRYIKYCAGTEQIYIATHSPDSPTPNQLDEVAAAASTYAHPPTIINRTEQFIHLDESFGFNSLKKNVDTCITELSDLPLVIILDPLYLLVGGHTSDEYDMRKLLDNLNILMSERPQVSVILIHHTRKAVTDESGASVNKLSQDASGTRAFVRWADTVIRIDLNENFDNRVNISFTKHRNAEDTLPSIQLKWHRATLHPQIISRYIKRNKEEEGEIEIRGELDYINLE